MPRHAVSAQVLRSTAGAEWIVIDAGFGATGAVKFVELISDSDAARGQLQHAFRMTGAEFRIFCAHAGIRSDTLAHSAAFADSLS